jgi:hypothetical protein
MKLREKFESWGFREVQGIDTKSRPKTYRFDKVCSGYFFLWFPREKSEFSKDSLVTGSEIILQNKAFSVGPAIFSKLVTYYGISGDVLQTQILSPRSTAYLGCLLLRSKFVGKIRVFGAGENLNEYQAYFDKIGATNIKLYAEKFIEFQRNSILEKTVAIYCTPPSSFSSINDPIELICSRGGDLTMLQFLSESEMNEDGKIRAAKVLQEQRQSLKAAMSKPQIQFILYETHSIVEAENEDMVQNAVEYTNRKARDKHVLKAQKERERLEQLQKEKENMPGIPTSHREREPKKTVDNESNKKKSEKSTSSNVVAAKSSVKINLNKLRNAVLSMSSNESLDRGHDEKEKVVNEEETEIKDEPPEVRVPFTDIYEVSKIPDFCENKDNCVEQRTDGCFLSLIRRKEIVKMDSKYLIQIAELRGIFGDKDKPKKSKSKAQIRAERKQELAMKKAREALERKKELEKSGKGNVDKVIERLLQPTQATIIRFTRDEIWRRRYHIMTLRYNQLFPPRCARCDYYSQNYYFLSDKFVTIKQFDDTLTFRFEEDIPPFQESLTHRRAEKWWKEMLKYLKQLQMVSKLAGTKLNLDLDEKRNVIPPLKLARFPLGYVAPPHKRKQFKDFTRQQYSLSIIILDIDQPTRRKYVFVHFCADFVFNSCINSQISNYYRRFKSTIRSVTPRLVTLKNFNRCVMCLNEYMKISNGYQQMMMALNDKQDQKEIMKYVEMRFRGGKYEQ